MAGPSAARGAATRLADGIAIVLGGGLLVLAGRATPEWFARHVLRTYAIARWEELGLAWALRIWMALAALGLVVVIRPHTSRWLSRASAGQVAWACARLLGALALFLGLIEVVVRVGFPDPRVDTQMPPGLGRVDPVLGWSLMPRHTTRVTFRGRPIEVAVDADGNRSATSASRSDPRAATMLFLGESVAFGWGLRYEESVPALVGRRLGLQAVSLAVPAYGNDQAYQRLVATLPRFGDVRAVVSFFLPVQLDRNLEYWRPRLVAGPDGTLVPGPAESGFFSRLRLRWLWHGAGYRSGEEGLRWGRILVRETAARARERGAEMIFVVPCYGPDRLPSERPERWLVEQLFDEQGIRHVEVDLPRALLHARDQHPNAEGARALALAIVKALGGSVTAQVGAP